MTISSNDDDILAKARTIEEKFLRTHRVLTALKEQKSGRVGARLLSSFLENRLEIQEDRLIHELDELIAYATMPKSKLESIKKKC